MDLPARTQPGPSSTLWRLHQIRRAVCEGPFDSRVWLQKEPDRDRARHWGEADTLSGGKSLLERRRGGLVAIKDLEYV